MVDCLRQLPSKLRRTVGNEHSMARSKDPQTSEAPNASKSNNKKQGGWYGWMFGQETEEEKEKEEDNLSRFHPTSEFMLCVHSPAAALHLAISKENDVGIDFAETFASLNIAQLAFCISFPMVTELSTANQPKSTVARAKFSVGTFSIVDHTRVEPLPCFMLGDGEWVNSTLRFVDVIEREQPSRLDPFGEEQVCLSGQPDLLHAAEHSGISPENSPYQSGENLTPRVRILNEKDRSRRNFTTVPLGIPASPGMPPFSLPSLSMTPTSPMTPPATSDPVAASKQIALSLFYAGSKSPNNATTTDVLFGVAAVMLDLKSAGSCTLLDTMFLFFASLQTNTKDKGSQKSQGGSQPNFKHAKNLANVHSVRVFLPHVIAAVRVADAGSWRRDVFFNKLVNSICVDIRSLSFKNVWQYRFDEMGGTRPTSAQSPEMLRAASLVDGIFIEQAQCSTCLIEPTKRGFYSYTHSLAGQECIFNLV